MAGDDFFRTRMGHRFFEATMPKVADELERLNANLQALLVELRMHREAQARDANGGADAPAAVDSK